MSKRISLYKVPVVYPIFAIAYSSSIFLLVFLTIERYLAICRRISISLKKTKLISFSIILICAILTSPAWVKYTWKSEQFSSGKYNIAVLSEIWRSSEFYPIYGTAFGIFLFVLPLILFLIFNILIIKKVRKSTPF